MIRNTFLLIFIFTLFNCSINYEEAIVSDEMSEDVPDTIMKNFTYISVRNGVESIKLEAETASTFENKNETIMENVVFQEFSNNGSIAAEGKADSVILFNNTEDAELSGNLYLYSKQEEGAIETDFLEWTKESKELKSNPQSQVNITKDSGTTISGKGFHANLRKKEITFSENIIGEYINEDED